MELGLTFLQVSVTWWWWGWWRQGRKKRRGRYRGATYWEYFLQTIIMYLQRYLQVCCFFFRSFWLCKFYVVLKPASFFKEVIWLQRWIFSRTSLCVLQPDSVFVWVLNNFYVKVGKTLYLEVAIKIRRQKYLIQVNSVITSWVIKLWYFAGSFTVPPNAIALKCLGRKTCMFAVLGKINKWKAVPSLLWMFYALFDQHVIIFVLQ